MDEITFTLRLTFTSSFHGRATQIFIGTTSEVIEHANLMYEANDIIQSIEILHDGTSIHTVNYDLTSGIN